MATQLQLRRGTTEENAQFTGAVGEVTVNTDKHTLIVHDGVTQGGAREIGELPIKKKTINFTGDVTGTLENFDVTNTSASTVTLTVVNGGTGGSGESGSSSSGGGQSFQFYKSADNMFGYFGSKAGATCTYGQDTITVTLPADCTVLSMYFCQDEEFITKAQCTINFDSTHVMTESDVTFDVDDLTTLCGITPYVQVFKIASNGPQDSRVGVSQVNTGTNTILMQGLPMGDARVFKLIF